MATITPDPMIIEIRGKAGNFVYYIRRGKFCARAHIVPRNPRAASQQANRSIFAEASASWKILTQETRNLYNLRALHMKLVMSGFNLYVSDCMKGKIRVCDDEVQAAGSKPSPVAPVPLRICAVYDPGMLLHDRHSEYRHLTPLLLPFT